MPSNVSLLEQSHADWKLPAWRNWLAHSFGLNACDSGPSACQSSSIARSALVRSCDLSLANAISIGFKSGL